ncbi:MAG: NAD-dependent epimerase/dehydratase family protein [Ilumatobacteraceae bacterium]
MKVLVTGASSMIGRAVVGQLIARGDDVVGFQRTSDPAAVPGAHEVLGDLADQAAVEHVLAGRDAVIHLAAKVGVTGPWHDYHRINVDGTARLVATARRVGVERFVHVSSPSVAHAGVPLVGAAAEPADPGSTRGHYATTKAIAELATLAASSDDLPIVAIRPHLVWGPGDTQLVGRIVDRGRRGRLALVGSGTALIDTTYVDNAADALIAALDRAPTLAGRAFVVSNGEPRTVHELVQRILAAAGVAWTPRRVPRWLAVGGGHVAERVWSLTGRTDDPPMTSFLAEQLSTAHWFDQRVTRSALGWEPLVGLAEGFDRLAASYRTGDDVVAT